ncbi:hypothetical protein CLOM621_06093 [Clostridium sp. M62/1]|nr:hypothetical protein CLOM621_06093 [Clostridium sp. M62/1]
MKAGGHGESQGIKKREAGRSNRPARQRAASAGTYRKYMT